METESGLKVLVIGNGAREHTFVWKLNQSPRVAQVFVTLGNAGINKIATPLYVDPLDIDGIVRNIYDRKINFTFVGGEDPLASGLVDVVRGEFGNTHQIFGPTKEAAEIESTKIGGARFNSRHHIPQPDFIEIYSPKDAGKIKDKAWGGFAVKADELDRGKGVVVCDSIGQALLEVDNFMVSHIHGPKVGNRMLIQERLFGQEVSVMAWVDGRNYAILPPTVDYKDLNGKNTGGVGGFSPFRGISPKDWDIIHRDIMQQAVDGLFEEGRPFVGILFAGLMITEDGPKVLEWNCRAGDPESQSALPLYPADFDILEVMQSCLQGNLRRTINWRSSLSSVSIVLASRGYPDHPEIGRVIYGLENQNQEDLLFFHGATKEENVQVKTAGGRVVTVTALDSSLEKAREKALSAIGKNGVYFQGMQYRKDIGS